ncbi:MAG: hypothetical protein H0T09_01595 [Actinobacteria bacterium]|nr:hypothetical protein [Actinomycetota bacterium]
MNAGAFLRRLERRVARFNKWLAPAAVASNVPNSELSKGVDPLDVTVVLGEIEQGAASRHDEQESGSTR